MEAQPLEEGRLVSLAEVKMMLTKAQLEREELTYEQKLALEHSLRFARLSVGDAESLIADLLKGIPDMNEIYAFKIADVCPVEVEDVKALFAKSRITIGDAEANKIVELVLKYYTPDEE